MSCIQNENDGGSGSTGNNFWESSPLPENSLSCLHRWASLRWLRITWFVAWFYQNYYCISSHGSYHIPIDIPIDPNKSHYVWVKPCHIVVNTVVTIPSETIVHGIVLALSYPTCSGKLVGGLEHFFYFSIQLGIIIPMIDFYIFRGGNHQPVKSIPFWVILASYPTGPMWTSSAARCWTWLRASHECRCRWW